MKIHREGPQDNPIDQAQVTRETERVARDARPLQGPHRRQVGLDRIEVSDVAETAARVVGIASEQRAERVEKLAQLHQAGQYVVDPSKLSDAIIDHDLEPDPSNYEK